MAAVEADAFALVPSSDVRVEQLKTERDNLCTFLSRFQDAHGQPFEPPLIICRADAPNHLRRLEVAASFRDLLVASTVPLARSLDIIFDNSLDRLRYSSYFWVYPWMLCPDDRFMTMFTSCCVRSPWSRRVSRSVFTRIATNSVASE